MKPAKVNYSEPRYEDAPVILDYLSLAHLLGLQGSEIMGLLKVGSRIPAGEEDSLYDHFVIPKSGGGTRDIHAPVGALKTIQTKIRDLVIDKFEKKPESVAYEVGSRPGDTAARISGAALLVKIDIKDFFPSILQSTVRKYFNYVGYPDEVSNLLSGLLCVYTKEGRRFLPQGGTASAMLANRIAEWLIDPQVKSILPDGWEYCRYCDNLYLWCADEKDSKIDRGRLMDALKKAIYLSGFRGHKVKVVPPHRSMRVLGLCVNVKANMPREKYKALKACLHNCSKSGFASQLSKARLLGFKHQQGSPIRLEVKRFILFLTGYLNYYRHYLVSSRVEKLEESFRTALKLEQSSVHSV